MNKTELKIVCVLKTGGDFDWSYVERLFKALSKHSTVEFTFVCFTDALAPRGINKEIEIIELVNNWPTWWSKVEIFNLPGPVVYFDLDTVIVGNIDDLLRSVDVEEERFIMRKNARKGNMSSNVMAWNGDYGWVVDKMLMNRLNAFRNNGKRIGLREKNKFFRGDQDWIVHTLKKQKKNILVAQKYQVGIYSYKNEILSEHHCTDDPRIIVFHGYPRPSEVKNPPNWLIENWSALSTSSIPILNKPKIEEPIVPSERLTRTMINRNRAQRRDQNNQRRIREWRPPKRKIFHHIPKIWDSGTCYILGGGPSLANVDVSLLNGKPVIAVNNSYKLAYFSEVLFWGDCWWFEQHRRQLQHFPGMMITTCQYEINLPHNVMHVESRGNIFGLSTNNTHLTWNLNAGACAVDLAVQLGAKRIVLLGYDMRQINGQNNWHSDHRTSLDQSWNPYNEFLLAWPYIAKDAKKRGIEIINATPGSALDMFPIVDLRELLGEADGRTDHSLCAKIGR